MTIQTGDNQNSEIDADVEVVGEAPSLVQATTTTEDLERIGKDIVVGRKEINYEDGKNVISVIINAISVRINMPRGTVKALMSCFAVLLLAVVILAINSLDSKNTVTNEADTTSSNTTREYPTDEESKAINTERAAKAGDYVIISPHYRYYLPDDIQDVWEPTDYYAENETFCEFEYADYEYSIRSYLLDYSDKELSEIVKADLSQFDNMKFLEEQHFEDKYGDVLMIRFETTDELGDYTAATGFYWYDSDPKICCLEIASDDWHDDGVEEEVLSRVYRVSSDNNEVPPDAEEIWQEQQKEDAMNSLVEDAMREQYDQEPDYTDRVLKP